MGLLDALTSIAGGASAEHHGIADALSSVMQEHPGGMDGILAKLKENGLGDQVDSWVKPGENQAVSADQVQQGLGASTVNSIAERAGISPSVASGILSVVLPLVVSHFSGSGSQGTPEAGGIAGMASKLFGGNS
ncbi:MAG: YidB family protein [Granulicella sp.]